MYSDSEGRESITLIGGTFGEPIVFFLDRRVEVLALHDILHGRGTAVTDVSADNGKSSVDVLMPCNRVMKQMLWNLCGFPQITKRNTQGCHRIRYVRLKMSTNYSTKREGANRQPYDKKYNTTFTNSSFSKS